MIPSDDIPKEEAIKLLLKMGKNPLNFAEDLELEEDQINEIVKKQKADIGIDQADSNNQTGSLQGKQTKFINRASSVWKKKTVSHICMLASMGFKIATISRMVGKPDKEVIEVIRLNAERIKRLYLLSKEKKSRIEKYPLSERVKVKHVNDHLLLTRILFSEAKSQSRKTKEAIAQTIINRTKHKRYPKTISAVITDPGKFSSLYGKIWQKSENPDKLNESDKRSYFECSDVAHAAIKGSIHNTIGQATLYHDAGIRPNWNPKWVIKVGRIGEFCFYEET